MSGCFLGAKATWQPVALKSSPLLFYLVVALLFQSDRFNFCGVLLISRSSSFSLRLIDCACLLLLLIGLWSTARPFIGIVIKEAEPKCAKDGAPGGDPL